MHEEVKKYMRKIAKKGGEAVKAKYDAAHFKRVGSMGGRPKKNTKKP